MSRNGAYFHAGTVTYPIFMLMNAVANIFGIGGGSLISRMLGNGEREKTGAVASFSLWMAGGITLLYSICCFFFDRKMLMMLGTDAGSLSYAQDYLFWSGTFYMLIQYDFILISCSSCDSF